MEHRFKMSKLKLACLLLGASLACFAVPRAEADVRPEPTPQMIGDQDVAFITFVAGEALTPVEQVKMEMEAMQSLADNHAVALRDYVHQVELAARIAGDPVETARMRNLNRRYLFKVFSKPLVKPFEAADAAALAAHDPAIAYDAARDILFTRRTIDDLRAASAWVAGVLGIPGPSAAFSENIQGALNQRLTTMDKPTALQMADIGPNLMLAQEWLNRGGMASIVSIGDDARAQLANADPNERDWSLAVNAGLAVNNGALAGLVARRQGGVTQQRLTANTATRRTNLSARMMARFRMMMYTQSAFNTLNQMQRINRQAMLRAQRNRLFSGCRPGGSGSESVSYCMGH